MDQGVCCVGVIVISSRWAVTECIQEKRRRAVSVLFKKRSNSRAAVGQDRTEQARSEKLSWLMTVTRRGVCGDRRG